ncbi:MAG: PKD domain-containing protein, partial [Bacteroidota bacterium]|nr:PKD domain-containing protein [Bacteroidota bacterium]
FTIVFSQAQCQADFSYIQNAWSNTVFTDLSTMQSTNYSATWQWDFGDGNTSTQQHPVHTYWNGVYSVCLTVTFFDSTNWNYCTSIYCDSILIGNAPPASWDCNPAAGCYDPGTGLGQYISFLACDTICNSGVTPSWDCDLNSAIGCYDPGTGLGQYTSFTACDTICSSGVTPSWDCTPAAGCYDPGTGLGQYTSFAACQAVCSGVSTTTCDSMTITGTQYAFTAEINNINMLIDYWNTSLMNGVVIAEDSMTNTHNCQSTVALDTVNICITYADAAGYYTCCVTWIWNAASGSWAKMGNITSIEEINYSDKRLIKIIDILGRKTVLKNNTTLFFMYDDGSIDRRYIIE